MAGGDFGAILLVGALLVGGIFLLQNPSILQQFAPQPPMEAPPAEAEEEPPAEEPEPEPQQPQTEYVPYPVPVPNEEPDYPPPPRPLTRKQICSRYYGGSCASECRQYGYGSRICQQCISYCGPPPPEYPRPRHYIPDYRPPRPRQPPRRPFPPNGRECPRGQRYNWQKRKCEVVPKPPKPTPEPAPTPTPETPPSTSPDAGTPESSGQPPANTNYGYSYYSGWY